ncbi:beta-1,4-galactosyltransferase 7 isoform X2 [Nematostella vectensis]|uniref:beta-1,4-galactosyltransferase 7 isoform X2 n=1 Tax=Nematostella vectensis TaxID=45351 RepID=UPI0020774A8B|nr:beta-1,4-galactosyltransferase 7 isoform X2 [Nematostella vectensis]
MVPQKVAVGLLFYLTCAVVATIYLSMMYLNEKECDCREYTKRLILPDGLQEQIRDTESKQRLSTIETFATIKPTQSDIHGKSPQEPDDDLSWGPHVLGVVVPYRNRFEELLEFVPHMNKFLSEKKIRHRIFIMNQVDKHRFNRASLLNVGYLVARNECDYIVMHDVDLLPLNSKLFYGYPEKGPFHISSPHLHPKYHYRTFVGGILMMTLEQFEKLYRHGKNAITTGYNTFKHDHDPQLRKRDYARLYNQKKESFRRDRDTGADTVEYTIQSKRQLMIDGTPCTIVNVELHCDYDVTPWCDSKQS